MEGHYRVPSLFSKRSNQALRPGPPPEALVELIQKVSTNEGLIGRAREDHRFGFRRANIFRRYQADLASSSLHWAHNSGTTPSTSPSPFQDRGGREGGSGRRNLA